MFRALIPPIFRSTRLLCYSLWYNAPTMLPAGSLEAEELKFQVPPLPDYRPATSSVHYTTSCNTQSSATEDEWDHRPKHVELIGIINKPLLLHLLDVYIVWVMHNLEILGRFHPFYRPRRPLERVQV